MDGLITVGLITVGFITGILRYDKLVIPKEQSGLNVDFILLRVSPLFSGSSGYV